MMNKLNLLAGLILACIAWTLPASGDGGAQVWPWLDTADDADAISVVLLGDNNFQYREDPGSAFHLVQATLDAADIVFLNLEGPFAGSSKDPLVDDISHKRWTHSEPDQVGALIGGGIDAVGIANNVTYPWQAMMRSIAVLEEAGIPWTGGGENLDAAHRPVTLERKGVNVGFLQYAATVFPFNHAATAERPGIAEIKVYTAYQPPPNLDKPGQPPLVITWTDEDSLARMQADITALADATDLAVVSYHWGVSGTKVPVEYQRVVGRAAIDAGADIVFGHGPHTYQEVEVYQGRPIMHSLGQFIFDDPTRTYKHLEGLLARVVVRGGKLSGVSLVPTWRDDNHDGYLVDPNSDQGRELFGYLKSVQGEGAAELNLEGSEIIIRGVHGD